MDPKSCLLRAGISLMDGDLRDVRECVKNYYRWRQSGGFAPTMDDGTDGDVLVHRLAVKAACKRKYR